MNRPPRIVLYGVGRYGQEFARLAAERRWPIVAAVNRAGAKVGRPLDELAGLHEQHRVIVADCDDFDYGGADADVAVVFVADRLEQNWVAHQRLLTAGINVICHGTESYFPWGSDPASADRINALAVRHGVTFTGTGIWDMSRIWSGILAAGQCATVESVTHHSLTQINYPSPRLVEYVGLDMTPDRFAATFQERRHPLAGMYKTIPEHVMQALGFTVTGVSEVLEPIVFGKAAYSLSLQRDIEAGRTVGIRFRIEAQTSQNVTASARIELRFLQPGETEHMVWEVGSQPRSRTVIERQDSTTASAAAVLNRIPDVIAASSGIRLVSELGPMTTVVSQRD
jgi:hypothetical protein